MEKVSFNKIKSPLRMKDLHFEDIVFKSYEVRENRGKLQGEFGVEKKLSRNNQSIMKLALTCRVFVNKIFDLNLRLIAEFSVEEGNVEKFLPAAVAIMFPYMRSQVSLMTAQPNLKPVMLPPFNINSLLKELVTKEKEAIGKKQPAK